MKCFFAQRAPLHQIRQRRNPKRVYGSRDPTPFNVAWAISLCNAKPSVEVQDYMCGAGTAYNEKIQASRQRFQRCYALPSALI